MAVQVITDGATQVWVNSGVANALQYLGLTRNGVNFVSNGFFLPVPCDDNGGDEGPPADIQYLGETGDLEMEFTKFDTAVADTVRTRMNVGGTGAGTIGVPGTPGSLMFSGGNAYRILLLPTVRPLNFVQCVIQPPNQINKGTRFSTWLLRATAYKNGSGVLYNTVTS